jgi:hypothetical protein
MAVIDHRNVNGAARRTASLSSGWRSRSDEDADAALDRMPVLEPLGVECR